MVQHSKEQSLVFCVWRGSGTKSVPARQDGCEKEGENEEGKGGGGLLMMALWLTFSVRASHVRECPNLNKTAENAQQNAPIPPIWHECEGWEWGFYSFFKHRYCMLCFASKWQVKYENSSALLWVPHTHKAQLKTQQFQNGYEACQKLYHLYV